MDKASEFINRTLSFRPDSYKHLGTLAEFEDRSMSAVARRLIEAEAHAKREEIAEWKRAQAKKGAA
jgi:predicted CopG family antitoxin